MTNIAVRIQQQLTRLCALDVSVAMNGKYSMALGKHVDVAYDGRSCTLGAVGFLRLLEALPNNVGSSMIPKALEASARRGKTWAII